MNWSGLKFSGSLHMQSPNAIALITCRRCEYCLREETKRRTSLTISIMFKSRGSRALRRLGDHCNGGHLCSTTLADIFVPLVGNYIVAAASLDHHLVNDAIITTGRMAKRLAWGAYYSLVQRYLKSSRDRDESERVYVRTLVAVLENFHFPMEEMLPPQAPEADIDVDVDAEEHDDDPDDPSSKLATPISAQPMDVKKLADGLTCDFYLTCFITSRSVASPRIACVFPLLLG